MVSSLLLKRFASSTLLLWSLSRTITLIATSASHFFNTNVVRQYDNESNDCDLDVDHRSISCRCDFFSGKEDVKVLMEQNTLVIKGEGAKEGVDEESVRRYTSIIDLQEKTYKTSEIKAEMKNGVLKVVVPKVKEKEMSDMFYVNIE